jgi:hypothetical protein
MNIYNFLLTLIVIHLSLFDNPAKFGWALGRPLTVISSENPVGCIIGCSMKICWVRKPSGKLSGRSIKIHWVMKIQWVLIWLFDIPTGFSKTQHPAVIERALIRLLLLLFYEYIYILSSIDSFVILCVYILSFTDSIIVLLMDGINKDMRGVTTKERR